MTQSSEKFCLKWNDFRNNIESTYKEFRENPEFSDVTLLCGDNQQIEVHRIILTACSPFFSSVLEMSKHSHPIIYMKGFKAAVLVAVVDFIYHGEVNIYQDDLDGFLALAEELQLKGLAGSKSEPENPVNSPITSNQRHLYIPKQEIVQLEATTKNKSHDEPLEDFASNYLNSSVVPFTGKIYLSSNILMNDLKSKIESMMDEFTGREYRFKCNVCGKTTTNKQIMNRHVERHIEGLAYPCNLCGKACSSSHNLQMHISRDHKNKSV